MTTGRDSTGLHKHVDRSAQAVACSLPRPSSSRSRIVSRLPSLTPLVLLLIHLSDLLTSVVGLGLRSAVSRTFNWDLRAHVCTR